MFNKILIANRGEIACRVISSARNMGIRTVAVYSDADQHAMHVHMADEAIHIGASPSIESYLRGEAVIDAALKTGAQAVHPGYGFLSENAKFAQQCEQAGLVFIGPPVAAIKAMGSKSAAKTIMQSAGVPLVPGYHGDDQDHKLLKKEADAIGYPVLLKAVAGGGGKGMRKVWSDDQFEQALKAAKNEAQSSFGDDLMLVEKFLTRPRHVEVQVFCDRHGNGVYLFERDCSVQRRHQKIIEEAPAPGLSDELRKRMGEAALTAAQAIDYQGAGTVEFLLDEDKSFYFMEMNTRLQVEHPVTEMITGEDLVEWQLLVAAGEKLPKSQQQLSRAGHSFEARIYAEDPDNEFLPMTGTLDYLQTPVESRHVRIDTGVTRGDKVSPYYDPMIAKLVVWDETRERALRRMRLALAHYRIAGVKTNIEFLLRVFNSADFAAAELDTGYIEKHSGLLFSRPEVDLPNCVPLAALFLRLQCEASNAAFDLTSPWQQNSSWRANQPNAQRFQITMAGENHSTRIMPATGNARDRFRVEALGRQFDCTGTLHGNELSAAVGDQHFEVSVAASNANYLLFSDQLAAPVEFSITQLDLGDATASAGINDYTAPMNGTVVEVRVEAGSEVAQGDVLLVMEAMKMQHNVTAAHAGTVTEIFYQDGDLVDGGAVLLELAVSE